MTERRSALDNRGSHLLRNSVSTTSLIQDTIARLHNLDLVQGRKIIEP